MSEKIRIAVLVSGGGTNLQALIDAQQAGEIPDEQRIYTQTVYVGRADTPDTWREATDAERSEHLNRHNTENKNNKDYEIIA